jgi:hypothetical protein
MKLHILKITDRNDHLSDDMFYTIPFLRDRVVKDWYDMWDESTITKQQIIESDELLFDYMDSFGYDIETILTITENDIPKRTDVIQVDVSFYHPNDNESIKVYDEEGMLEEFQYKLDCIIKNSGL